MEAFWQKKRRVAWLANCAIAVVNSGRVGLESFTLLTGVLARHNNKLNKEAFFLGGHNASVDRAYTFSCFLLF